MKKIYLFWLIMLISLVSLKVNAQQSRRFKRYLLSGRCNRLKNGQENSGMDIEGKPLFEKAIGSNSPLQKV